jgi:hypothetical protein
MSEYTRVKKCSAAQRSHLLSNVQRQFDATKETEATGLRQRRLQYVSRQLIAVPRFGRARAQTLSRRV